MWVNIVLRLQPETCPNANVAPCLQDVQSSQLSLKHFSVTQLTMEITIMILMIYIH